MTNPSPAYAAGRGEAVAWIAFNEAKLQARLHRLAHGLTPTFSGRRDVMTNRRGASLATSRTA